MTLDASDFSLFTQKCLEKYNLVDNVDGELKVRSGSSTIRARMPSVSQRIQPKGSLVEETIDEDAGDYSDEDDITDEWDGLILSDVKRMPKFK